MVQTLQLIDDRKTTLFVTAQQHDTAAIQRGDQAAFDAFFRQWYGPLCQYAAGMTDRDMGAAEDIVQNAFIKLWEQRATLELRHSLKAYLYKAVHNACLNRIRDRKTAEKYVAHQTRVMEHQYVENSEPELADRIRQAIADLPAQCRHVFELSRFEDLKYREIADHLNISPKTVENQMGRALAFLRLRLAEYLTAFLFFCFNL
jgi:RNA polymerase sigma-70 factor (family 1)